MDANHEIQTFSTYAAAATKLGSSLRHRRTITSSSSVLTQSTCGRNSLSNLPAPSRSVQHHPATRRFANLPIPYALWPGSILGGFPVPMLTSIGRYPFTFILSLLVCLLSRIVAFH